MEAERVSLYAMSDEQAESLNAKSYTDFCEYWTTGKPLTTGAAVVLALFPDLDAAVAEELGRLVDAWPSPERHRRLTIRHCDGVGVSGDWSVCRDGEWFFSLFVGFRVGRVEVPLADPAAVCAAIGQVRERIGNG